jgi:hypothetical protein
MNAYEVIGHFEPHDLNRLSLILAYLAEHSYEARLRNGGMLRDATDFREWLRELSAAAKVLDSGQGTEVPSPAEKRSCREVIVSARFCPRCGHVHEERDHCGVSMGSGGICRCVMEVRV